MLVTACILTPTSHSKTHFLPTQTSEAMASLQTWTAPTSRPTVVHVACRSGVSVDVRSPALKVRWPKIQEAQDKQEQVDEMAGRWLSSLLRFADYPTAAAFSHREHLDLDVAPHLPKRGFKSFMTDDHTPVELSLSWTQSRQRPAVRYCIDPSDTDLGLKMQLGRSAEDWKKVLGGDEMSKGGEEKGESEVFWGWDLDRNGGRTVKNYFMPKQLCRRLNVPALSLLPGLVSPDSQKAAEKLVGYVSSLPASCSPELIILAGDAKSRLKAYFRYPTLNFARVLQALALGEQDKTFKEQAGMFAELWEAVTGRDPRSHTPATLGKSPTAGTLVYYDLAGDVCRSKLYIPVRHLASDDERVARGFETFLQRHGFQGWQGYRDAIGDMCNHRSLSLRAGVHTYIGCSFSNGQPEVIAYVQPEANAPERGRRRFSS